MKWKVPNLWFGETCYIIGGGEGVKLVDLTRLQSENVIAINAAFYDAPFAAFCYFQDCSFFHRFRADLAAFGGIKVTVCSDCCNIPWIMHLEQGTRVGCDMRPDRLSWGTNSGYGALALALKLGPPRRIYLLGYDMHPASDGRHNYHDRYLNPKRNSQVFADKFLKVFPAITAAAKSLGVEILNATPGSALDVFPIVDPDGIYPQVVV